MKAPSILHGIADAFAGAPHRLGHLGPTRYLVGKGSAGSVRRLDALSASLPALPPVPADVAAVRNVHRQPPPH
nr:hypothetical protein [Streptomyces sp. 846.5]